MTTRSPTNLWLWGISGRMGQEVAQAVASESSMSLLGGSDHSGQVILDKGILKPTTRAPDASDNIDVVVDFSTPQANDQLFEWLTSLPKQQIPKVVIATTGLGSPRLKKWREFCETGATILMAPNTSIGVLATLKSSVGLAKLLHSQGYDIEIVETHHKHKVDSPSGTALLLANGIARSCGLEIVTNRTGKRHAHELGISAIRGGGVFGDHQIRFLGEYDEVTISHRASSRRLFANGAITLCKWLINQPNMGFLRLEDLELNDLIL